MIKPPKAINPRTPDTKYTGPEPAWVSQPDTDRASALVTAFGWYNYYCSRSDAKNFIQDWLERQEQSSQARSWRAVPENTVPYALGWLARMNTMGLILLDTETQQLNTLVETLLAQQALSKPPEPNAPEVIKPNIQDRLREKLSEAAADIEGMFDDMILSGNRMGTEHKPMNILRAQNVAPQLLSSVKLAWQARRDELVLAVTGNDADLTQGYAHYGKLGLRNMIKFCEQVMADCDSYVQIKKVERKPRAKKMISPEKLTQKFRYLPAFPELKLTSEAVTRLVNAQEAWLYDTQRRKLIHVVADSHVGSFTVKNSALVGYDPAQSVQKTLRKPQEQLRALLSGGLPQARKYFKDIKTTETKFNGRSNDAMIILKAK